MTGITILHGNEMVVRALRRTTSRDSTVVTIQAVTLNPLVIPVAAGEGCGGMTEMAIQHSRYMIR